MKLIKCLEIGRSCDLETVGEAMLNIDMHAISIFDYEKLTEELSEMHDEFNSSGFTKDTLISSVLKSA